MTRHFIAFDLGATSGRTILGTVADSEFSLTELTRFPNKIARMGDHYYWDIVSLYENIIDGLKAAAKVGVPITSIGIDTWGVDMVLFGKDGNVAGIPYSYRDPYTLSAQEDFFTNVMSRKELYARTGIQILNFNSLFQLYAMGRNEAAMLEAADKILFFPDALSYLLTGNMVTEYTIASTSQFLDPYRRTVDKEILGKVNVDPEMFPDIVMPGEKIGTLKNWIAEDCGLPEGIPVIAVAGHDTASAVAAVPAVEKGFAYLSSGTWSLMGIETPEPVITEETYSDNITNEGGADGSIRLLKNITGMWILERCMKEWESMGRTYTYPQIVNMSGGMPSFRSIIDPDASDFANPSSMTASIVGYCQRTSQPVPRTDEEFVCCIFESLALKYREVIMRFMHYSSEKLETLHIIGGGSKNALLNQYAANATGLKVVAGPAEATAIGNIMIQAKSAGLCGDFAEMRRIVSRNIDTRVFLPENRETWDAAFRKYSEITK